MIKKIIKGIHTTTFQQIIIFFTIAYIGSMLVLQYKQSYFAEENYKMEQVSETEKRLASRVEAGLNINNFPHFSFYKNEFTMDAGVWFKFPIGTESLQTIEKFSFKNGEILSKADPVIQLDDNNVIISYQVLVKFITPLNYKNFPVSDHKLTVILQNKSVSPNELYFYSDVYNFELADRLLTGNWVPAKRYVDNGYVQTSLKKDKGSIQADFPGVAFTIDFRNEDLRHFIILYLPLFLIFLLIFASLLMKIDDTSLRFPIVASVIPILALHSLVVENISPPGSHMTKVDQIYFTLILLALLILIFQAYLGMKFRYLRKEIKSVYDKAKGKLKVANDILIIFVLSALIAAMSYATFVQ